MSSSSTPSSVPAKRTSSTSSLLRDTLTCFNSLSGDQDLAAKVLMATSTFWALSSPLVMAITFRLSLFWRLLCLRRRTCLDLAHGQLLPELVEGHLCGWRRSWSTHRSTAPSGTLPSRVVHKSAFLIISEVSIHELKASKRATLCVCEPS